MDLQECQYLNGMKRDNNRMARSLNRLVSDLIRMARDNNRMARYLNRMHAISLEWQEIII
jgi:hypothetical protein